MDVVSVRASMQFLLFLLFLLGFPTFISATDLSDAELLNAVKNKVRIKGLFGRTHKREMLEEAFKYDKPLKRSQAQILRHLIESKAVSIHFSPIFDSQLDIPSNVIRIGTTPWPESALRYWNQLGMPPRTLLNALLEEGAHHMLKHGTSLRFSYLHEAESFLKSNVHEIMADAKLSIEAKRLHGELVDTLEQLIFVNEIHAKSFSYGNVFGGVSDAIATYQPYANRFTASAYFPEMKAHSAHFGNFDKSRANLFFQYQREGALKNLRHFRRDFKAFRRALRAR